MLARLKKVIMVISDDPKLVRTLQAALGARYQVSVTTASGEELRHLLGRLTPDMVIVDIAVPSFSGMGLSLRLRQWAPELPVLLLTAWGAAENMVRGLDLRAAGYLTEPITPEKLLTWIEDIFRHHAKGDKKESDNRNEQV